MKLRGMVSIMGKIATFEGVHSSNTLRCVHIMSQECAKEESVPAMQYNYITCVHKRSTLYEVKDMKLKVLQHIGDLP